MAFEQPLRPGESLCKKSMMQEVGVLDQEFLRQGECAPFHRQLNESSFVQREAVAKLFDAAPVGPARARWNRLAIQYHHVVMKE